MHQNIFLSSMEKSEAGLLDLRALPFLPIVLGFRVYGLKVTPKCEAALSEGIWV